MITYRNRITERVAHFAEPVPIMDRSDRWERVDAEPEPERKAEPRKRTSSRKPRARKAADDDHSPTEHEG